MSSESDPILNKDNNNKKKLTHPHPTHHPATSFRLSLRRAKRRLPTVRLGNKKPRRGFLLVRLCRKVKLKWLKLKYLTVLKKLKKYYDEFVKDMLDGSATLEAIQQRLLLETSFAVPVMGIGFNTYPSRYGVDRPMF